MSKVTMENVVWSLNGASGCSLPYGAAIWHDGSDIHFTRGNATTANCLKLEGGTGTNWVTDSFSNPFTTSSYNNCFWTDGTNIYYSYSSYQQLKYDVAAKTWSNMTWEGCNVIRGNDVWTDGADIYYSNGSNQFRMVQIKDTKPCYLRNSSGEWVKQNAYIKNDSGTWEQVSYK